MRPRSSRSGLSTATTRTTHGTPATIRNLVRDEPGAILEALQADADLVIVSGGSSVGVEDLAPMLVAQHGELAVHGIAMRPSSPTGLADRTSYGGEIAI